MELEDKVELNKFIKSYVGENSYIISLKKQLKSSKYLERVSFNGRMIKVFTEKQYLTLKSIIEFK